MNTLAQEKLIQENDNDFTDAELNMLAAGEPAVDLDEIAESQHELSDDYMAEEKEQELDIKVIKASEKSEELPVFFTDKKVAAAIRGANSYAPSKNSDGSYL